MPMSNNLALKLGERIRYLRNKQGRTQEDLAESIGTTQPHFAKIEQGSVNIGLEMIQKIAAALDVEVAELFEDKHDMPFKLLVPEINKLLGKATEQELRLLFRVTKSVVN